MEGGNGGGSVGMEVGEDDLTDEEVVVSAKFKMKSVKSDYVVVKIRKLCFVCFPLKPVLRSLFYFGFWAGSLAHALISKTFLVRSVIRIRIMIDSL